MFGRLMAEYLGKDLKQAVFVENKAGAQGAIGAEMVAHAEPDGYTLFGTSGSVLILNPLLYKKLSYDPVRDFRMLALVTEVPVVLCVNPSVPAKTIAELVAYARQNPGKLNFGSSGTGSFTHLAGEMFKEMAGIEMTHVAYKGAAPALTDVMSGNIQLMFESVSLALPHVRSGSLRPLGVSSTRRIPDLPDVPTIAESGYPDYFVSVWNGVAVPAGLPDDVARILTDSLDRVMSDPAFRASLEKVGYTALASAQCRRHHRIHRYRPQQVVGCDKGTEHFIGLRDMVRESEIREGELAVEMPEARSRRSGLHRPHPHALDLAAGDAAAGAARRPGLPARDFRAVGAGAEGRRLLLESRSALLAASVAPRPRAAKRRRTTNRPAARSRCARRCGPIRSAPRSSNWSAIEGNAVLVRGLDCLDETPLIDLKPDRCEFTPLAPPQAGDFETE